MTRASWVVFLSGLLFFSALRLAVAYSAVDHLHNVDTSDNQIAHLAHYILHDLGNEPQPFVFSHLWGTWPAAYALIPLLKLGFTDTEALTLLAFFFSLVGFGSLLFMIAKYAGAIPAAFLTLLFAFPHPDYLKWNLVLWAAYPEAANLALAASLFFVEAAAKKSPRLIFLSGILTGIVFAFSPSVFYLPPTLALLAWIIADRGKKSKALAAFSAGTAFSILLCFAFIARGNWLFPFDKNLAPGSENIPVLTTIAFPQIERLSAFFDRQRMLRFLPAALPSAVFVAGLAWCVLKGRTRTERWRLLFPATILFGLLGISMFPLVAQLEIRHVLWTMPALYAGTSLLLGDRFFKRTEKYRAVGIAEYAIKGLVLAAVLAPNISPVMALVQPNEMGVLRDFRGYEYYRRGIGLIVGKEIGRVNCYLDHENEFPNDKFFTEGIRSIFPTGGIYHCCLKEPRRPTAKQFLPPPGTSNEALFRRGAGCALALKGLSVAEVEALTVALPDAFKNQIRESYKTCAALPCLTP